MKRKTFGKWAVLFTVLATGCSSGGDGGPGKGDGGGDGSVGTTLDDLVKGRVFSARDGRPVSNVDVFEGERAARTGGRGRFEFERDSAAELRLDFRSPRTSSQVRRVPRGASYLETFVLPVDARAEFRLDEGVDLRAPVGTRVRIGADRLEPVGGGKTPLEGELRLTTPDLREPAAVRAMPGDLRVAASGGGTDEDSLRLLRPLGAVEAVTADLDDPERLLRLRKDDTATIDFRIDRDDAPPEAALFRYDEEADVWLELRKVERSLEDEGAGRIYRAEVDTLGWYAVGQTLSDLSCVRTCVVDEDGQALGGATLTAIVNHGEMTFGGSLDAEGCGAIDVPASLPVRLVVAGDGVTASSQSVGSGARGALAETDPGSCIQVKKLTAQALDDADCPAGTRDCGGDCVDVDSDPDHCGGCGTSCAGSLGRHQSCVEGACGCREGQTACGELCVDAQVDFDHCGSCDNSCPATAACSAGKCDALSCPGSLTACSATCVNTSVHPLHCGACDTACADGLSCMAGECVAASTASCTRDADCTRGQVCNLELGECEAASVDACGGCPAGQACDTVETPQCVAISTTPSQTQFYAYGNTRLDGDLLIDPLAQATAETVATTQGGSVTIAADGTFAYTPVRGFESAQDQFDVTVGNGVDETQTTITVAVDALLFWVDGDAVASGDGTSESPYATLAEVTSNDLGVVRDVVVQGTVSEDFTLQPGQELWGNRGGTVFFGDGVQVAVDGSPTTIDGVVTLPATGYGRVRWVAFAGADVGIRSAGSTAASVRIDYVDIVSASGNAFFFDGGGTGSLQIDGMTVDTSGASDALAAVQIQNSATTYARGVLGGTLEVVGGGTGPAVSLSGNTLNSVIFDRVRHATGPALDVGDCQGVLTALELVGGGGQFPARIRNASGAMTVSLSNVDVTSDQAGGSGLVLDTLLGTVVIDGLQAASAGASTAMSVVNVPSLEVLGVDNALLADGGDVLAFNSSNIGAQGVTFARIDNTQAPLSGSCTTGVDLQYVGGAGAFVVDGGTGLDGGSLSGCSDAVTILNADDVRLALMAVTGNSNAISYGTSAAGSYDFQLDRMDVSANTGFGVDASSVGAGGLAGVVDVDFEILSSNLDASASTLNALLLLSQEANTTVRALVDGTTLAVDTGGLNIMRVAALSDSTLDLTLRNSPLISAPDDHVVGVYDSDTTSVQCVSVSGNTFSDPDGVDPPDFFFNQGGTSTLSLVQLDANSADVGGVTAALTATNSGPVAADTVGGTLLDAASCTLPTIPALP